MIQPIVKLNQLKKTNKFKSNLVRCVVFLHTLQTRLT